MNGLVRLGQALPAALILVMIQGCDEGGCNALKPEPELQDVAQIFSADHRTPLTREQIVQACQIWVACTEDTALSGRTLAVGDDPLASCIGLILLASANGEVIIDTNESARFVIDCLSSAAGDCDQVLGCSTRNPLYAQCAAGCPRGRAAVTCNGSVATVETEAGVVERDCARADRACDPDSVSGCNDALRYSCPRDQIGYRVDSCWLAGAWCEGDVVLACNVGQVSIGDCAALGGACQETSQNRATCVYPDAPEPGCESLSSEERGTDTNGEFQCVRGRKVYLE